jgi:hypothetical protein
MYICIMEYGENIMNRIKSALYGFHKLLSIEKFDDLNHKVYYVKIDYYNNEPCFLVEHAFFDFKVELREARINSILKEKGSIDIDTFDVESIIYTEEQIKRLSDIRSTQAAGRGLRCSNFYEELKSVKIDYSKSFKVGEPVYYNGHHGIITFKHNRYVKHAKETIQLWSVKVGETEHRYVSGCVLRKRTIEDLSKIPIDEKLNKLSTERLLKMYKAGMKRNRGMGSERIKRILNEREHIKKGESKTIIHPH